MEQPTQKQIKEFLQWCGFTCYYKAVAEESVDAGILGWIQPPDNESTIAYYGLTLDFLFKYAVPKLYAYCLRSFNEKHKNHHATIVPYPYESPQDMKTYKATVSRTDNPALALFWAIWQVIQESNNATR